MTTTKAQDRLLLGIITEIRKAEKRGNRAKTTGQESATRIPVATSRKSPGSLETTTSPQILIHHSREDRYEDSSRPLLLIFRRSGTLKTYSYLNSIQTRIGLERNAASQTTNSLAPSIAWETTIQTTRIQATSRHLKNLRTEANGKTLILLILPKQTIAQTPTRRHRAVILSQIPFLAGHETRVSA